MPPIVHGNVIGRGNPVFRRSLADSNIDYNYPEGLDLRPNSITHGRLRDFIIERAHYSRHHLSRRFPSFDMINKMLTAYIPLDEEEILLKAQDHRKPVSIVIPTMYATLETFLAYMTNTLLLSPYFKYDYIDPDDAVGVAMLEQVVDMQARRNKMALNLHTWWRDGFAYGYGLVNTDWVVHRHTSKRVKTKINRDNVVSLINGIPDISFVTETARDILFEGNKLSNIDPYMAILDPNTPIQELQDAEFVGWLERTNLHNLRRMETTDDTVFNVEYLRQLTSGEGRTSLFVHDKGNRGNDNHEMQYYDSYSKPVDIITLEADIIPSEFELSSSNDSERWLFRLAADELIITAVPLPYKHGFWSVAATSPDFDGYSTTPTSKLEIIHGLQHVMNFYFNSHIQNIRKSLNDMFLIDTDIVDLDTVLDPSPGKIMLKKRSAWGRSIKDAVTQFPVVDVTSQNVGESQLLNQMMQQVSGASEQAQGGQQNRGERVSATESRNALQGSLSRIEKTALLSSIMGMQDLGYMMASNTQQYAEQDYYVKITGRYIEDLKKILGENGGRKSAADLNIPYEVSAAESSIPGSGDPNVWLQAMQLRTQDPEVYHQTDGVRMYLHLARLSGAKNITDFLRRGVAPQFAGPEEIQNQVQAGNLRPVADAGT